MCNHCPAHNELYDRLDFTMTIPDGKYGTLFPETETMLGSICDDVEYVRRCLTDMTNDELREFERILVEVYRHVSDILKHNEMTAAEARQEMLVQLDQILGS